MKKTMMLFLFLSSIISTVMAQLPKIVTSDKKGWHKIGETTVDFQKERDEIVILVANRFSKIKLKVTEAPIAMLSAEAYFESGDKQDIKLKGTIKAPGESNVVQLHGGERTLQKIVLIYKTVPNYKDKKAHLEIWGLKTNTDKK